MNHQRSRLQLAINAAVDSVYEDTGSLRSHVAKEMLTSCIDQDERAAIEDADDLQAAAGVLKEQDSWTRVTSFLEDVEGAIRGHKEMGIAKGEWKLPYGFSTKKGDSSHPYAMEELSTLAMAYARKAPGSSPRLEKFLVAALIHAETHSTWNHPLLKEEARPSSSLWTILWALFLLVTAAWSSVEIGRALGAAFGVTNFAAWSLGATLVSRLEEPNLLTTRKMLQAMKASYMLAARWDQSPLELEDRLKIAEAHGAVWPSGVRTLVAQARDRDQARWRN